MSNPNYLRKSAVKYSEKQGLTVCTVLLYIPFPGRGEGEITVNQN